MEYMLSIDDIKRFLHKSVIVISADNREDLGPNLLNNNRNMNIIIHYQTSDNSDSRAGHWCGMYINNKEKIINFFDSYGIFPDNELNDISATYRHKTGQDKRDVGIFLNYAMNHGYKIYYNEYHLQADREGINTCGRYIALFLKMSPISIESFHEYLKKFIKGTNLTFDDIVVMLTKNNIGH